MTNNNYIKRSDAFKWICERCIDGEECQNVADPCYVEVQINKIPAADVEPVRHGWWIPIHNLRSDGYPYSVPTRFWCNQCGSESKAQRKFCPNCGAKMDAKSQEE